MLDPLDQDTIFQTIEIAKFLHANWLLLGDLNIRLYGASALIGRLDAMPDDGQSEMDQLGDLKGLTFSEFKEMAYLVGSTVKDVVVTEDARYKLWPVGRFGK